MSFTRKATASAALWLHLRRRAAFAPSLCPQPAPPPGEGPLIVIHVADRDGDPAPLGALIKAMLARRPGMRFAFMGEALPDGLLSPDLRAIVTPLPRDADAARALIDSMAPRALLLVGDHLPAALILAMNEARLPVILCEARLADYPKTSLFRGAVNRGLMARVSRVLAPDPLAASAARALGADAGRIEMTGPVTETLPPLGANEAERLALAQILSGRHVWLAAAPTLPEIGPLLAAHQLVLQHNHRALLILAGLPEAAVPGILAQTTALGLGAVLRSEDEDPSADDHVLIADDPYEMGLWYRLAPVCFMGGTLIEGDGLAPRHPFEPAALGSAIIHGPQNGPYGAEWVQLDGAAAARQVISPDDLTLAIADLAAPDQAAILAGNAWAVSTGGAAVLRRIADAVIDAMEDTA